MIRKSLDRLYLFSGALASLLIAAICLLVCAQVALNLVTRLGVTSVNLTIPSYADFAGYFLAGASFLSLAYTLTRGGHIRVTILVDRLPIPLRRVFERVALAVAGMTSAFATWYIAALVHESYRFGDQSPGIVSISLWLPQSVVLLGMAILTIALFDHLTRPAPHNTALFASGDAIEAVDHD